MSKRIMERRRRRQETAALRRREFVVVSSTYVHDMERGESLDVPRRGEVEDMVDVGVVTGSNSVRLTRVVSRGVGA